MSNASKFGPVCPFCQTEVPANASVCTGCGARKGMRVDAMQDSSMFVHFALWMSSVGLVLLVALYMTVSAYQQQHSVFRAVVYAVLGLIAVKLASKVWRAIFGSLSDPRWIR